MWHLSTCSTLRLGLFLLLSWEALVAPTASAHLMPTGHGTIHLIDRKAYVVLSLPVAAFFSIEACRDGVLTSAELQAHRPLVEKAVRSGLSLQAHTRAAVETVLINLPTGIGHPPGKAEDLLVMMVAEFAKPPASFSFQSTLWANPTDTLTIESTVSEGTKTNRVERGKLSQRANAFTFFASSSDRMGAGFVQ